MKNIFVLINSLIYFSIAEAQLPAKKVSADINIVLLDTTNVSLKGKNATAIIINHTADTINLKGNIYYYLPVFEQSINLTIPPGKSASLQSIFFYPDFIKFNSVPLQIYIAPGKTVQCDIESTIPFNANFKGDLSLENTYYQSYTKIEKNNSFYYQAGAQLKDFNKFPKIADSINQININYLNTYSGSLSSTFKQQEYWRLMYNNAFLKYHVLFDKEAKTGQPIAVNDDYYKFEKDVPLSNKEMVLSTEYLWYAIFNLRRKALIKNKNEANLVTNMLSIVDSIYQFDELGDVLKMRFLYDTYPQSKQKFLTLDRSTPFLKPSNKLIMDSVVNAKNLLPRIGRKVPALKLINMKQDSVSLDDFAGHQVIVNFWATWCGACIIEFPFEISIYNKYNKINGLAVVNVCVDSKFEDWKKVSIKNNLQMINLYANPDQYEYLKKQFNLYALPRSIFISRDMKVTNNSFKRASLITDADINN